MKENSNNAGSKDRERIGFWNSIVSRFALFFTALIVFSILLSGYLVFNNASKVILRHSEERLTYSSDLAEQLFNSLLAEVSNDVGVLSESPVLMKYVNNPNEENKSELEEYFEVNISHKPIYFQLRYINIEGNEVIRFDREGQNIIRMPERDLQYKGDRDYFIEATKIGKGELYFSEINLNQEYGVISDPHIVTLRVARPIFNDADKLKGIVIINVNLRDLYKSYNNISESDLKLYLIDEEGQYLFSPEAEKMFAKQLETGFNFLDDFELEKEDLQENSERLVTHLNGNEYLSLKNMIEYFEGRRKFYLISVIRENLLMKSVESVRANSLKSLVIVLLLTILLSYYFTRFFSGRIMKVTKALTDYADGGEVSDAIHEKRKDEIGVLTRSFVKMRDKIDDQVQQLNQALEHEKEAKRQRDQFLQNMSHEIRTPLNAILGLIKLLEKSDLPKSQLPILNSLKRSAGNLEGLVYDVLDHKKLVEGKLNLSIEPVNLGNLLRNICTDYQYEAMNKGLKYEYEIEDGMMDMHYLTDPLRLSQMVINLIVNAIKYTHEGNVKVFAQIKDETQLHISIRDTGIGMDDRDLNKINQGIPGEIDIQGRFGSYGLGLSIVRQLVQLFEGKIEAESKVNEGSHFKLTIPVKKALEGVDKAEKHDSWNRGILKDKYTILHIEDDEATRLLFKYRLGEDHRLIQISDTNKFEKLVQTEKPDLVISDLMLNNTRIDSFLTNQQVGEVYQGPLIICSALDRSDFRLEGVSHLQKPFDFEDLEVFMIALLGKNEFHPPVFDEIYKDYDHDDNHTGRVFQILIKEFSSYIQRVEKAKNSNDEDEWTAIKHKLSTHVKNLNLVDLEKFLSMELTEIRGEDFDRLIRTLKFYVVCIRVEMGLLIT